MSNLRFEMHQIRQVLVRMRMGESNRAIAKAGLMSRNKAAELRNLAQGWLQLEQPLPDDEELAAHCAETFRAVT
ncbi:MAG: hypothetical protein GY732_22200 [Gammaproteobacteria bacterium]|nr:hypothetical protein [Gammaproteobacteria bacterium]